MMLTGTGGLSSEYGSRYFFRSRATALGSLEYLYVLSPTPPPPPPALIPADAAFAGDPVMVVVVAPPPPGPASTGRVANIVCTGLGMYPSFQLL